MPRNLRFFARNKRPDPPGRHNAACGRAPRAACVRTRRDKSKSCNGPGADNTSLRLRCSSHRRIPPSNRSSGARNPPGNEKPHNLQMRARNKRPNPSRRHNAVRGRAHLAACACTLWGKSKCRNAPGADNMRLRCKSHRRMATSRRLSSGHTRRSNENSRKSHSARRRGAPMLRWWRSSSAPRARQHSRHPHARNTTVTYPAAKGSCHRRRTRTCAPP
mmetsp:Transcript_128909/g.372966  ORF Transcript_128909/g.372966 Transcript_128909/m.372966 type:complete len:218 (-) Transcript_128909:507-1160(-)